MSDLLDRFLQAHEPKGESFDTELSPSDEMAFRKWKEVHAPKDSGEDYDLRGAFKANVLPNEKTGHWPDTFKKPNHPTFSNESKYAKGRSAGKWEGEKFIPPAQGLGGVSLQLEGPPPPSTMDFEEPPPGYVNLFDPKVDVTGGRMAPIPPEPPSGMELSRKPASKESMSVSSLIPKSSSLDEFIKEYEPVANEEQQRRVQDILSLHASGKGMDIDDKMLEHLIEIAQKGHTANETLLNTAKGAFDAISEPFGGVPGIGIVPAVAKTAWKGVKIAGKAALDIAKAGAGVDLAPGAEAAISIPAGLADLGQAGVSLALGAGNLIDQGEPDSEANRNYRIFLDQKLQRFKNKAVLDAHSIVGSNPESPTSEAVRFASQSLVPMGGATKALTPVIARTADAVIENVPKALLNTGRVAKYVAPAAGGATALLANNPTLAAEIVGAGYGIPILKGRVSKIYEFLKKATAAAEDGAPESPSSFKQFIDAIDNAPNQTPIYTYIKESVDNKISDVQSWEAKLRSKYQGKLEFADDLSVGVERLKGPDLEVRKVMDEIKALQDRSKSLAWKSDLNKVLSYYGKLGLTAAGETGVGGGVLAGFAGSQAQPKDVREAAKEGFTTGVALTAPFAKIPAKAGLDTVLRNKNLNVLRTTGEEYLTTHDSWDSIKPSVDKLKPEEQKQFYANVGWLRKLGTKVEIISESDIADMISSPREKVVPSTEWQPVDPWKSDIPDGASFKEEGGQTYARWTEEGILDQTDATGEFIYPKSEKRSAPNGWYDSGSDTVVLNADKLTTGVDSHEGFHAVQQALDFKSQEFSKSLLKRIKSPSMQQGLAYSNFKRNYVDAAEQNSPNYAQRMTPEMLAEEATAELARLLGQALPPQIFYGGKGGDAILSDWINRAADYIKPGRDKEINLVPGFDAPYTKSDMMAVLDMLYEAGRKAKSGEKNTPSLPAAEPPAPPKVYPKEVTDAAAALKAMGWKLEAAKAAAEAAHDQIQVDNVSDIVRRAQQNKNVISAETKSEDLSGIALMPSNSKLKIQKDGTAKAWIDEKGKIIPLTGGHPEAFTKATAGKKMDDSAESKLAGIQAGWSRVNLRKDGRAMIEVPENKWNQVKDQVKQVLLDNSDGVHTADISLLDNKGNTVGGGDYVVRMNKKAIEDIILFQETKGKASEAMLARRGDLSALMFNSPDAVNLMPSSEKLPMSKDDRARLVGQVNSGSVSPEEFARVILPDLHQNDFMGVTEKLGTGTLQKIMPVIGMRVRDRLGMMSDLRRHINAVKRAADTQMMPSSVNVGLDISEANGGGKLKPEEVVARIKSLGIEVPKFSVVQSGTEQTVVADLSRKLTPQEAHQLSIDLRQDAIPQLAEGVGEMHGPGKDKWGAFNGEYYYGHDGKPLISPKTPERATEAPNNAPEAPPQSQGLSGVSLQRIGKEEAKLGPIIDESATPAEQRFQELFHKEDKGLTPQETEELNKLHWDILKKYGSVEAFEKKYPAGPKMMPSKNVKWIKPEPDDSYYHSDDKRFEINPLYLGRERPQAWEVTDNETGQKKITHFGLKNAQSIANEWKNPKLKPEADVLPNEQLLQLKYNEARLKYLATREKVHMWTARDIQKNAQKRGFNLSEPIESQKSSPRLMPSTPPEYKRLAEQYGLRYDGIQEGYKAIPAKHSFTDPSHGSSFTVPVGASPEQLLAKIKEKRDLMNPPDKMQMMPSFDGLFHGSESDSPDIKIGRGGLIFASTDKDYATTFRDKGTGIKGRLHQLAANIDNPKIFRMESDKDFEDFTQFGFTADSLKKEGHDGAILTEGGRVVDVAMTNVAQMKHLGSSSRLMPSPNKLGFYSKLEQVAEDKLPERASVEQIKATLAKGGVKADELKWTGTDDWLASQEKLGLPVTKKELLNHIRENSAEIKEVVKGRPEDESGWSVELGDEGGRAAKDYGSYDGAMVYDKRGDAIGSGRNEAEALAAARAYTQESPAKFSEYVLPGGDPGSYREASIVHPGLGYVGPHTGVKGELAHVRYDTRTSPEGKSLRIAEIQSDLHQTGRKEGYAGDSDKAAKDAMAKEYQDFRTEMRDKYGPDWQSANMSVTDLKRFSDIGDKRIKVYNENAVPDAPFKKNWHELALKRMIRKAAEEGYDAVTWDTGATQKARYNLSNHIAELRISKLADGRVGIDALGHGESAPLVISQSVESSEVAKWVGKDMAEKIASQKESYHEYTGLDLEVGGEGMNAFYDKMLVSSANDIGKKFGSKVESAQAVTAPESQEMPDSPFARNPISREAWSVAVHKLPITPEMRQSVMEQGFPQFMPSAALTDAQIKVNEKNYRASNRDAVPFSYAKNDDGTYKRDPKGKPIPEITRYDFMNQPLAKKATKGITGRKEQRQAVVDIGAKELEKIYQSTKDIPEVASARGWYRAVRDTLRPLFKGDDAEIWRFCQLIGATSSGQNPRNNLLDAISAYRGIKSGRFNDIKSRAQAAIDSGEYSHTYQYFKKNGLLPTKENGAEYGKNSPAVLKVLTDTWAANPPLKTGDYAGNFAGKSIKSVIDQWAARTVRRALGGKRIAPEAEGPVSDAEYKLAQDMMHKVADKAGEPYDDLQALLWFAEKNHWGEQGHGSSASSERGDIRPLLKHLKIDDGGVLSLGELPDELLTKKDLALKQKKRLGLSALQLDATENQKAFMPSGPEKWTFTKLINSSGSGHLDSYRRGLAVMKLNQASGEKWTPESFQKTVQAIIKEWDNGKVYSGDIPELQEILRLLNEKD